MHQIFPTEGGLKKFTPTNENEWEYQEFLMSSSPEIEDIYGYLPLDKAICGDAIIHIYNFLCEKEKVKANNFSSGEILMRGMMKKDSICQKSIDLFLKFLGTEVSNFALETLPSKGIYLMGGYLSILKSYIKQENSAFLNGYFGKGPKVNEMLAKFPIYFVPQEDLISSGCIVELKRFIINQD